MKSITAIIVFLCMTVALMGQATSVNSITTTTTTIGATNVNGSTFNGLNRAVTGITDAAGNTYIPTSQGTDVFIRRNTSGNANNTSITFAQGGSGTFASSYSTSLQTTLLSNNIYRSSDNIFANGTAVAQGNIERVDFLFNGSVGITATSLSNVSVFERGLAGAHDGFNITLITGWDSNTNTPTSFTTITTVSMLDFGPNNVTVDGVSNYSYNYNLFRYNTGDTTTNWTANTETGNQGIGAVILDFFGLGANNGQTIYGYSIAANDTTTKRNKFDRFDNSNWYPTNSTNGFDPYGVNGLTWEKRIPPVPEPSTYGAIFMSISLGLLGYKRWRKSKS